MLSYKCFSHVQKKTFSNNFSNYDCEHQELDIVESYFCSEHPPNHPNMALKLGFKKIE